MRDDELAVNPMTPRPGGVCGAKTRQGGSCGQSAMPNGRCRFHGGLSTGPRTVEGLARIRAGRTIHGGRSKKQRELHSLVQQLRAEARRICEVV